MTARNNLSLHSLNPEIFKKWIFFNSSVKDILTCCIIHNFPQVITNIKIQKHLITHSYCIQLCINFNTATFSVQSKICVTIPSTETWCFCPENIIPDIRNIHCSREQLETSFSLFSSFLCKLVSCQCLKVSSSSVLDNLQQHFFLENSNYKCFREHTHTASWKDLVPLNISSSFFKHKPFQSLTEHSPDTLTGLPILHHSLVSFAIHCHPFTHLWMSKEFHFHLIFTYMIIHT